MRFLEPCLALSLLVGGVAAQQNIVYHDDNVPGTGRANAFPFGARGVRQQQIIPGSVLGATPALIQDIYVAAADVSTAPWTESEVVYGDIEIRFGTTTMTTLTTSWTQNAPNAVTLYRGPLRVRFVNGQWSPLGLPRPIPWVPASLADNLVIDVIVWQVDDIGAVVPGLSGYFMASRTSATTSPGIARAFLLGWTGNQSGAARNDGSGIKMGFLLNDGSFVAHGGGCAGSGSRTPRIETAPGAWPQINGLLDVRLADGPTSSAAFLGFGFDNRGQGAVRYPFDLTPIGAPGCQLWHDLVASISGVPTDPAGAAQVQVGLANDPSLVGVRLYTSWLCLDPGANAIGFTSSGFATVIVGT